MRWNDSLLCCKYLRLREHVEKFECIKSGNLAGQSMLSQRAFRIFEKISLLFVMLKPNITFRRIGIKICKTILNGDVPYLGFLLLNWTKFTKQIGVY